MMQSPRVAEGEVAGFIATLRSGGWLTWQRLVGYSLCTLAVSLAGLVYVLATSDGLNDYQGRPIGSDFSHVYAAGTYVREGNPTAPFDWPAEFKREKEIFGAQTQFYGWHYPPFFLFIAGALATMPYQLALLVWQLVTLVLYLVAIRAILFSTSPQKPEAIGHVWLLIAFAYPAVFINIGHGHNGFLSAALIGGGLALIDRRPAIAGVLFGLMAYKPQFGVLIPLVLIASGRWRVFAAAAITVVLLTIAATAAFGLDVWRAFFDSMRLTRSVVLEEGATGWYKIQTIFSWVRMWGGSIALAYAAQAAVALAVMVALMRLWWRKTAYPLQAAAFAIGTILVTPYSLDYDLMLLAPAIAFLASDGLSRGFGPWEKTALAVLWFMPLVARSIAQYAFIPVGVLSMLAMFALVLRYAQSDVGTRSADEEILSSRHRA